MPASPLVESTGGSISNSAPMLVSPLLRFVFIMSFSLLPSSFSLLSRSSRSSSLSPPHVIKVDRMTPQVAFSAPFEKPTEPTIHRVVVLSLWGHSRSPPAMPLLPSNPADECLAYVDSRRPIGFCTPTRSTPSIEDRCNPLQNMRTFVFPTPFSELSTARHQSPIRKSEYIQSPSRARAPAPAASSLPVTFAYGAPAKVPAKSQAAPISWRGGHHIKTAENLLTLGLACLVCTGFQPLSTALASSPKTPLISVEMRAAMLALKGALGSFKVASKACQQ